MAADLRLVTVLLLAASACALGKTKVPEGAKVTWDQMNQDQKMAHMTAVVAPRMKALFQAQDLERFADFGCQTCHAEGTFDMPNPDLPHLSTRGFYKKHRKENPEILKFMWKTMEPNLADALGVTHGEHGRIRCATCHILDD